VSEYRETMRAHVHEEIGCPRAMRPMQNSDRAMRASS